MKFVNFFNNIGELRKIPRRGSILIGSKQPASVSDHLFRTAIMALILGKEKKNLNLRKVLEIALIHDFCELYIGDKSPYDYDSMLSKDKKKWPELFDKWPRYSLVQKKKMAAEKRKKEENALNKLIKQLPPKTRKSLKNNWFEYKNNLTKEAKFVKQINRLETLLQALEHSREEKIRVYKSWWIGSREKIDDPVLIKFMDSLAKEFRTKE